MADEHNLVPGPWGRNPALQRANARRRAEFLLLALFGLQVEGTTPGVVRSLIAQEPGRFGPAALEVLDRMLAEQDWRLEFLPRGKVRARQAVIDDRGTLLEHVRSRLQREGRPLLVGALVSAVCAAPRDVRILLVGLLVGSLPPSKAGRPTACGLPAGEAPSSWLHYADDRQGPWAPVDASFVGRIEALWPEGRSPPKPWPKLWLRADP